MSGLYTALELPSPHPKEEEVKEEVKPVKKEETKKEVKPVKKEETKKEVRPVKEEKEEVLSVPFPSATFTPAFARSVQWVPAAPDQTAESVITLKVTYKRLAVPSQLPADVVNKTMVDSFLPNLLFRLEGRTYAFFCPLSGDGFDLRLAVWRVGAWLSLDGRHWR